ncbi:MAG: SLC13 family permease [Candidatus Omnitrophica bacterium]|nr:SLC13 family permease [Candidatus Omnitrophota bacterium]
MRKKFLWLITLSLAIGALGAYIGLSTQQALIVSVFATSVLGTLFFWDFRLSFVFIGSGILLMMNAVHLNDFILFASLDVILFLISMMIIVGMMKEAGLFTWLVTLVLRIKNLNGMKLYILTMLTSAFLSGLMGEVASIIVVATVILNICDFLEVDPIPLIISSIMATNIGSAATVLGNPVGVLIAARGKLSFEDFLIHALPVSLLALILVICIILIYYQRSIKDVCGKLKDYQDDKSFLYLISIPPDRRTKISIGIFAVTILLISLHKRLEMLLGLTENTLLFMIPVISAGIVMAYRHDKARHYIEREVEWPSILFFMFLFAQAGVIQSTGIASFVAQKMIGSIGSYPQVLSGIVLMSSGFFSSGVDNVVAVASYVPIVQSLGALHVNMKSLWWALLFGACYGGNITLIGSTANIVALGLLEKERNLKVDFMQWLRVGFIVGVLTMFLAMLSVVFIPFFSS